MDNEQRDTLGEILGEFDHSRTKAQGDTQRRKAEEEAFSQAFIHLRNEVIHPAMNEIGQELRTRGHDCQVRYEEEGSPGWGGQGDAKVTMIIFPAPFRRVLLPHEPGPGISFIAHRGSRRISVCLNTILGAGGECMPKRLLPVAEMTREVVEGEILGAVRDIFRKAQAAAAEPPAAMEPQET